VHNVICEWPHSIAQRGDPYSSAQAQQGFFALKEVAQLFLHFSKG